MRLKYVGIIFICIIDFTIAPNNCDTLVAETVKAIKRKCESEYEWEHEYGRSVPRPRLDPTQQCTCPGKQDPFEINAMTQTDMIDKASKATQTMVSTSPCPTKTAGDFTAISKQGAWIVPQIQHAVRNVHSYLSQICSNPIGATSAAMNIRLHTTSDIIKNNEIKNEPEKRPGNKPAEFDSMDEGNLRRIIHQQFFSKNKPPTLKKLLTVVKTEMEDRFPYGQEFLRQKMKAIGFKYGKPTGGNQYLMHERLEIVLWRAKYLQKIRAYRKENRPIIYLDETWFNSNDAPSRVWQDMHVLKNPRLLHQPGSGLTRGLKTASGHGQRLIIVNAVQKNGLVPGALLVFPSKSPITPSDFHKDMDSFNFENWFKDQLLPNLPPKSVIVMDNASYHSRKSVKLPTRGRRADVLAALGCLGFFEFLQRQGEAHDPSKLTMKKIFKLCRDNRKYFDRYAVEELAEAQGHNILRLPPYHCVLNPIEKLWAYQKRLVLMESTIRTEVEALEACKDKFSKIPGQDLKEYFENAETEEQGFWVRDGLTTELHPPVIIPVYDDEDDDDEIDDDLVDLVNDTTND